MFACTRAALLPNHGLRCSPPRSPRAGTRIRRVKHPRQPHHAAPQLPCQLYHEPAYCCMRLRCLLAPANLRGLPGGLSPLALHHLAPAVRRISSAARLPAAVAITATTTARVTPGGAVVSTVKHSAVQRSIGQRQPHRAAAVHGDVQRS